MERLPGVTPKEGFFVFPGPSRRETGAVEWGVRKPQKESKAEEGAVGCEQRPLSRPKAQEAIF